MRFTSLSAQENDYLTDLCQRVEEWMQMMVVPPLELIRGGVPVLGINLREGFPAKIRNPQGSGSGLGSGSGVSGSGISEPSGSVLGSAGASQGCRYGFVEVRIKFLPDEGSGSGSGSGAGACSVIEMRAGRLGTSESMPAVEITGRTDVADGAIVWLTLADSGDHYEFFGGGFGACTGDGQVAACVNYLFDVQCVGTPAGPNFVRNFHSVRLSQCAVDILRQIGVEFSALSCAEQQSGGQ